MAKHGSYEHGRAISRSMIERASLDHKFQFPALTRADIAQALEDDGISAAEARKRALAITDAQMQRLAERIILDACGNGAYWQLCLEARRANK